MGKVLLAAIDSSPQRRLVLDKAAEIGACMKAELHVVSVNDLSRHREISFAVPNGEMIAVLEAEIHTVLDEARDYLARMKMDCRTHAPFGATAEQIALLAGELRADGIIIGHRHLSWLGRLVEGSVGSDLVARTPCDVLIVVEPDKTRTFEGDQEPLSRPSSLT
ncbi:universal stress protein [Telmatospirillum siberiense]|nr:universal stress protein [Telmatospirillum siberiense]